ncbi:MAG: thiamine pyrophosphate-binding protein [Dehalococcoidia bacterium]|nr:thiamine pyrophosphate-binding protein [Dehalococcoidia bacterium]
MAKISGSKYIAETLVQYGVTHVFWVPGGDPAGIMAALEGRGVKRVLTHGEKAAAYMADGYARATGRPGICIVQSIGAANLAAGMADPYMASSPVIAMTGALDPMQRYRHSYQEFEHLQPFQAVTKHSVQVDKVQRLPDVLRQAFRTATSGSPGPVHLDIRNEALDTEADLEVVVEERFTRTPPFRPEPEAAHVREAAALLMQARKPVIVAGGGVITSGAWNEVRRLAEMLTIPVATSLTGKAAIPNDHPLSAGVMGRYSRWCANRIVSDADLVLFIGTRTGALTTADWRVPPLDVPNIQINIDPDELGRNYPANVALLGDAQVTLQRLIDAVEPREPAAERVAEVRRVVGQWEAEYAALQRSNAVPIRPERLCRELTEALPPDAILVSDTGHAGMWTGTMVELKHAGLNYIRCAGSLGWGLPGAIGVKCGAPNRPVVCFTGDGGFWYHIGELETAVRHGISPVIVVNDNHALNQGLAGLRRNYGGELWGDASELIMFNDVNLAQVAQAMGCYAERVERPQDIQGALKRALAAGKIAVVDVATDFEALGPTPRSGDFRPSVTTPFKP